MRIRWSAIAACVLLVPLVPTAAGAPFEEPIVRVRPQYPKIAREARIQGVVRLAVLIDDDGAVEALRLISGHPFLVKAAIDAAAHWRFRPTGRRISTIEITFTLREGEPPGKTVRV